MLSSCLVRRHVLLDPHFFTREVRLPVLFADLPPPLRRGVDAGSSKVQERQPTCLFVQVIIGCATAKAGCLGSFGSSGFFVGATPRNSCPLSARKKLSMYLNSPRNFRYWFLRGQGSCLGKNLEKKPTQGTLPKSRPLENPPAALTNCVRIFRIAKGGFIENSLKNMVSLRTIPQDGVAIRSLLAPTMGEPRPSSVTAKPCHLPSREGRGYGLPRRPSASSQ